MAWIKKTQRRFLCVCAALLCSAVIRVLSAFPGNVESAQSWRPQVYVSRPGPIRQAAVKFSLPRKGTKVVRVANFAPFMTFDDILSLGINGPLPASMLAALPQEGECTCDCDCECECDCDCGIYCDCACQCDGG